MASFGSSVINKSQKKLAPKLPVQRRRPKLPTASNASNSDHPREPPSSEVQINTVANVSSISEQTARNVGDESQNDVAAHAASPRVDLADNNEGDVGLADSQKDSTAAPRPPDQATASSQNNESEGSRATFQAATEQSQDQLNGDSSRLSNRPVKSTDPISSPSDPIGLTQRTNGSQAPCDRSVQHLNNDSVANTLPTSIPFDQHNEDASQVSHLQQPNGLGEDPEAALVNIAPTNRELVQTVKERIKRKRKAKSSEKAAGDKPRKRGHRREWSKTPEDAEDREIAPATIRMNELCKDQKIGRKSKLEQSMRQIDWSEVVRKRKEVAIVEPSSQGQKENMVNERLDRAARERESAHHGGPQLRIVNGQMVVDQASLIVDRRAEASRNEGTLEEVEEDDLTTRVNSHSWLYDNRRDPAERGRPLKSDRWTTDQTEAFYDALRMFGTDFYIISRMFPGKTRRQIKLKFVREERSNPTAVKAALVGETVPMDFDAYLVATGQEEGSFKDPKELEAELQAEDDKHKEEIEKRKEEHAELMRQRKAAGADTDGEIGESSKENKRGKGKKNKKVTAKKKKQLQQPRGGEEVEILGDA